jgi:hypothetical protein
MQNNQMLTKTETTITNSKTFHPSESHSCYTMINLSLFLVFAALFNAATGYVIEEITPPTPAGTPPALHRAFDPPLNRALNPPLNRALNRAFLRSNSGMPATTPFSQRLASPPSHPLLALP